jgi:hypothetical protein
VGVAVVVVLVGIVVGIRLGVVVGVKAVAVTIEKKQYIRRKSTLYKQTKEVKQQKGVA